MKKLLLLLSFLASQLLADTSSLTEVNSMIKMAEEKNDLVIKQLLICERDTDTFPETANPQNCIKAAQLISSLNKDKLTSLQNTVLGKNKDYFIGESFYNAGIIYGAQEKPINAFKMFEQSNIYKYPNGIYNLGIYYYFGQGVKQDKIKGIKLVQESEKHGINASKFLDMACAETHGICN